MSRKFGFYQAQEAARLLRDAEEKGRAFGRDVNTLAHQRHYHLDNPYPAWEDGWTDQLRAAWNRGYTKGYDSRRRELQDVLAREGIPLKVADPSATGPRDAPLPTITRQDDGILILHHFPADGDEPRAVMVSTTLLAQFIEQINTLTAEANRREAEGG